MLHLFPRCQEMFELEVPIRPEQTGPGRQRSTVFFGQRFRGEGEHGVMMSMCGKESGKSPHHAVATSSPHAFQQVLVTPDVAIGYDGYGECFLDRPDPLKVCRPLPGSLTPPLVSGAPVHCKPPRAHRSGGGQNISAGQTSEEYLPRLCVCPRDMW